MREIKFKTWGKLGKKMHGPFTIKEFMYAFSDYDEDNVVFLLYTGLKDKHGKDIYEGDIIERTNLFYGGQFTGAVTYAEGVFTIKGDTERCFHQIYTQEYIEVVGNIYENPELLT